MIRRLMVPAVVACTALLLIPSVHASTTAGERNAEHERRTYAEIECQRAQMQGRPCDPPPDAEPASPAAAQPQQGGPAAPAENPEPQPEPEQQQAQEPAPQQADPAPPPQGGPKRIEISITEQVLRAWEGDHVVLQTPVSTGRPGQATPTGHYAIQDKHEMYWSRSYGVWMPWAMRVVGGIFIHELPVTTDGRQLGGHELGQAVSAGCIRVGVGAAEALFHWADSGTPVVIH